MNLRAVETILPGPLGPDDDGYIRVKTIPTRDRSERPEPAKSRVTSGFYARTEDRPSRLAMRLRRRALQFKMLTADAGPVCRRGIDIMVSGSALLALSPLLAAASVAVKATSPGPVLYKQERLGRNAKAFSMLKFRTMFVDADAKKAALEKKLGIQAVSGGVRFKMKKDPRLTPIGGLLRRFSVDELPQIWNVLKGDMTLVGPRPPVRREVEQYDPQALRRLEVTQGLTCLWQVGGRSDLSFDEQVELDLEYIDRTRASDEIKIVAKTIPAVVTGRGAY